MGLLGVNIAKSNARGELVFESVAADAETLAEIAASSELSATYAPLPGVTANALTGKFHVNGQAGADMTGVAESTAAFQAAVDAAKAVGGTVYVPPGIISHKLIDVSNTLGLTIEYAPHGQARSKVHGGTTIDHLFGNTGAVKRFTLRGATFVGATVDDVTVPRRSRTYSGTQVNAFVIINGDLVPAGGYPEARDVVIEDCHITGTSSLPVLLRGIRGRARVARSSFTLTMDVGWTFCERVECVDNTSIKSADNAFSMSRGNQSVHCAGNYAELCAYSAYFAGGFVGDKGPTNIDIVGNQAKRTGLAGIQCDESAKYGTITGNMLDGGYYRGTSDDLTDAACVGIFLAGFPDTDRANPTDWADGFNVSNNTIRRYPRAGVLGVGVKRSLIQGNVILDIGTQYLADGTTAISSADQTQNVGILLDQTTTNSDVVIALNHIVDSRSTPYMNWAIYPVGSSVAAEYFNSMVGARNAYNLVETGPTRNINWGAVFQTNVKATAGLTCGANAATGTIAGVDINGADGSNRMHNIQTAGSIRWRFGADGTADTSTSTGSNFQLRRHLNDGNYLDIPLEVTRSNGQVKLAIYPVKVFSAVTGSRPTASAAGVGAHMFDTTLGKPIWSDGTNWKDATGTTV